MADAVVSLWLEDGARSELDEGLATGELAPLPPLEGVERVRGWVVEERRPKRYERDWADGTASPGVMLLPLMRPPEGRSPEDCARYWREQHTPLALRVHVRLWNYVQNVVREPLAGGEADVFGIVELHFRSRESLREERYDRDLPATALPPRLSTAPRGRPARRSRRPTCRRSRRRGLRPHTTPCALPGSALRPRRQSIEARATASRLPAGRRRA